MTTEYDDAKTLKEYDEHRAARRKHLLEMLRKAVEARKVPEATDETPDGRYAS